MRLAWVGKEKESHLMILDAPLKLLTKSHKYLEGIVLTLKALSSFEYFGVFDLLVNEDFFACFR